MQITNTAVRNAKPREKPYKMAGGDGLYLMVNKSGSSIGDSIIIYTSMCKSLAIGVYKIRQI